MIPKLRIPGVCVGIRNANPGVGANMARLLHTDIRLADHAVEFRCIRFYQLCQLLRGRADRFVPYGVPKCPDWGSLLTLHS